MGNVNAPLIRRRMKLDREKDEAGNVPYLDELGSTIVPCRRWVGSFPHVTSRDQVASDKISMEEVNQVLDVLNGYLGPSLVMHVENYENVMTACRPSVSQYERNECKTLLVQREAESKARSYLRNLNQNASSMVSWELNVVPVPSLLHLQSRYQHTDAVSYTLVIREKTVLAAELTDDNSVVQATPVGEDIKVEIVAVDAKPEGQ
mmetsp:Transcript_44779/g.71558  ORF Transcript_44779/g.71558 Transcript_44779/m.71558 type:complete len:205 (+) Transcript_44779:78-692(+)